MRRLKRLGFFLTISLAFCFCNSTEENADKNVSANPEPKDTFQLRYEVLNIIPHKEENFTQGLEFYQGGLIETSGLYAKSVLKKVNASNGEVEQKLKLPKDIFVEGCTVLDDKVYMLTWKEKKVFVANAKDFSMVKKISMPLKEGWGLTKNKDYFIASDGSHKLYFIHPKDWSIHHTIEVTHQNEKIVELNELEWVNGYIYANKWFSDNIYKIDPNTGKVVGILDLSNILSQYTGKTKNSEDDVLNGIAYRQESNTFFVTGKNWQFMFEISIF